MGGAGGNLGEPWGCGEGCPRGFPPRFNGVEGACVTGGCAARPAGPRCRSAPKPTIPCVHSSRTSSWRSVCGDCGCESARSAKVSGRRTRLGENGSVSNWPKLCVSATMLGEPGQMDQAGLSTCRCRLGCPSEIDDVALECRSAPGFRCCGPTRCLVHVGIRTLSWLIRCNPRRSDAAIRCCVGRLPPHTRVARVLVLPGSAEQARV